MKTIRTKVLSIIALIAVLFMLLFWMLNTFEMTVHQMGYDDIWTLSPNVRIEALLIAFEQSKITLFSSILTTMVIVLSIIDQINYIDEQERVKLLREDFSYAMVHDMKSPLTSIIMGTRYLHSGVLERKPDIKEKYFAIVEDEAQHLLALITIILFAVYFLSNLVPAEIDSMPLPFVISLFVVGLALTVGGGIVLHKNLPIMIEKDENNPY